MLGKEPGMLEWNLRFHQDAETGLPHIFEHGLTEEEVRQVLARPGEEFAGRKTRGSRSVKPLRGAIFKWCLFLMMTGAVPL
jgi:hypothetical protein